MSAPSMSAIGYNVGMRTLKLGQATPFAFVGLGVATWG